MASAAAAAAQRRASRIDRIARRMAHRDRSLHWPLSVRLLMTISPFAGFALIIILTFVLAGGIAAAFIVGTTVGSFVGAGKFVILAGMVEDAPVNVWFLATLVVYGDIATTLVMLANFHFLFKLPFLGRRLLRAQEASWNVLRANRWMRRMAWIGVAVFIAMPFQGTGAVVGTVLARLLALSPWSTVTAVAFGSALGCYPLALLGANLSRRIETIAEHPIIVVGFFVALIALLGVLGRRFTGASMATKRHTRRVSASAIPAGQVAANERAREPAPRSTTPVPNVRRVDDTSSYVQ